jgi:hypothetical protein
MLQLRRETALVQAKSLRPTARRLTEYGTGNRFISSTGRLQGKEWKGGISRGYIHKPEGLTQPQWDKLQTLMKWRSLAYHEYFFDLFGSSDPMVAKREWYQWVKSTTTRQLRDDDKAKEVETLLREVYVKTRDLQKYALRYFDRCALEEAQRMLLQAFGPNATNLQAKPHRKGDSILDEQLKSRAVEYADKLFKSFKLADETGEPEFEPEIPSVGDLIRDSIERYGRTPKEPEKLANYKRKWDDLLPPEELQAEPTPRVYDPISQRMVPVAAEVIEDPGSSREVRPVKSEVCKVPRMKMRTQDEANCN